MRKHTGNKPTGKCELIFGDMCLNCGSLESWSVGINRPEKDGWINMKVFAPGGACGKANYRIAANLQGRIAQCHDSKALKDRHPTVYAAFESFIKNGFHIDLNN